MRYLDPNCRTEENFVNCARIQMSTHYDYFLGDIEYSRHLAISSNERFKKYKDKKILIVGGGPSSKEHEWDPSQYDYVFSCNHFFLFDRLKNVPVDFASVCPEVDVKSAAFMEYLHSSDTLFCIDNVDVKRENVEHLLSYDRCAIAILRFNLKMGTTIRLLVIASYFQPSEIHVVGMDGVTKDGETKGLDSQHSFQPGKPMAKTRGYEVFYKEYQMVWNYLRTDLGKGIKYKNLGHGHPYNVSTAFNII